MLYVPEISGFSLNAIQEFIFAEGPYARWHHGLVLGVAAYVIVSTIFPQCSVNGMYVNRSKNTISLDDDEFVDEEIVSLSTLHEMLENIVQQLIQYIDNNTTLLKEDIEVFVADKIDEKLAEMLSNDENKKRIKDFIEKMVQEHLIEKFNEMFTNNDVDTFACEE